MSKLKYPNVYVVGPTFGLDKVFPRYGYTAWTEYNVNEAPVIDMVCWTGGSDISPALYNQKNVRSYPNKERDEREVAIWNKYRDKPKLGVCRGAQLLNVLNGGSMYQDCDRHGGGEHEVYTVDKEQVIVCSIHHQLMIPEPTKSKLIAWTERSTYRENDNGKFPRLPDEVDPEVLYYKEDNALCFQAHPEFGPKTCTDYFFKLIEEYIH